MPFSTWDEEISRAVANGRPPGRPGDVRIMGQIEKTRDQFLSQNLNRAEFQVTPTSRTLVPETPVQREAIGEMPRRKIEVGQEVLKEPIFVWAFASSQARGGQIINYETRLMADGVVKCNCPGWVFSKGDKSCKHTKRIEGEVKGILEKYKSGEELPTFDPIGAVVSGATTSAKIASSAKVKYGRLIEL
jgi:hypothetical protein